VTRKVVTYGTREDADVRAPVPRGPAAMRPTSQLAGRRRSG